MAADKKITAPVMMTKAEAKAAVEKVNLNMASAAAIVIDIYKREGWKALGYKSWRDCAEKEFSQGRSRVYQLLDEAKLSEELGPNATGLSGRALRSLQDVPKEKRKGVVKDAQKEHKTATPTEKQIKATAQKKGAWKPSGVAKKKTSAPKAKSIAEMAKDDEALKKALAVLGGTCGRNFRNAIEDGTIEMTRHDIIHLSEQDDETMLGAEKLISVNRWPLKRALSFLNEMPTLATKLEQLTWLAVASPEDKWEGTFGAFTVTVEVNRKKL